MTHANIHFETPEESPDHKSRKKRRIMLATLGVCGILIAVILLSDPRVVAQIDTAADSVISRSAPAPVTGASATQITPVQPAQVAPVQTSSVRRVRVRRAGILSDD